MGLTIFNKKQAGIISNPDPGGCEVINIYWDPKLEKVVVKKKSEPVE
ncbi:unnamed protein product [marine sediment metagenome]|uniref:Uncharacterized protein n=1 Tax=marine sediment metagenome TaxID=412755 RepID=X1GT79_9ZZZZ